MLETSGVPGGGRRAGEQEIVEPRLAGSCRIEDFGFHASICGSHNRRKLKAF